MLEVRAGGSTTTKTWTDNLVKTVIIMMNFSRGGHEGYWLFHLLAVEAMLPFISALLVFTTTHAMLRSTFIT